MTDLVPSNADALDVKMRYAKALAEASLLPNAYRKQPANVLLAMEYGDALGLSPMVAIQSIHVIDGKPTASAQLIGALVRRAGHRLRVETAPDGSAARATVIRSDDPDYEFTSVWTLDRAQAAGLLGKGSWKAYPAAMLKARAITEVARDACPEVLSGVVYTPEELGHDDPDPVIVERSTTVTVDPWTTPDQVVDAEIVEPPAPVRKAGRRQEPATPAQRQYLGRWVRTVNYPDTAAFLASDDARMILGDLGFDDAGTYVTAETLTKTQASALIDAAKRFDAEVPAGEDA